MIIDVNSSHGTLTNKYQNERLNGESMKVKVLGIQTVDYVSRKTGNPVKGITLHATYKDAQVAGDAVSNIFISDNLALPDAPNIQPGMTVDIEYNNRGYVADARICK